MQLCTRADPPMHKPPNEKHTTKYTNRFAGLDDTPADPKSLPPALPREAGHAHARLCVRYSPLQDTHMPTHAGNKRDKKLRQKGRRALLTNQESRWVERGGRTTTVAHDICVHRSTNYPKPTSVTPVAYSHSIATHTHTHKHTHATYSHEGR